MFALGIHYLNGWSMAASDGARKERSEWPPHPDRVFMALAAAWFETGEDAAEEAALRWLEGLPPPAIAASDETRRTPVVSYVPVNDDGHKKINPKTVLATLRKRGLAYLPEHRSRQRRSFPVAVPHDPTVHLIWCGTLDGHRDALADLAAKVTHIGHSASLVQAWVEEHHAPPATWEPTASSAIHRLRVPSKGRLARLASRCNRDRWIEWRDLHDAIFDAQVELKAMKPPPRVPWRGFPDAVLLAPEPQTRQHPEYAAAKSGDAAAAGRLVEALVEETGLAAIRVLLDRATGGPPVLASAHAYERDGFNAIPAALARLLGERLGTPFDTNIVQTNIVGHTRADGYGRLARQAAFGGEVEHGREYVMVDDFIGQGGTLANLRGWIENEGGRVIGAVGLTGKSYSARLNPTEEQLHELRQKHGDRFEKWWQEYFGHAFDCLAQSEARYLTRSPDADTIRSRLAAAMREGGGGHRTRSLREQQSHLEDLKAHLADRFPEGEPRAHMRPDDGKWQGYGRRQTHLPSDSAPRSVFDPRIVVLGVQGRRVSLPTTLKLTKAVRGFLMRECPWQPPPEWFSGHLPDGRPTRNPHLAIAPLPFVGTQHADGRIMGVSLILPRDLDPEDAGEGLGAILHDPDTGLPREHRLFDSQWFEVTAELDARERPPANLNPRTWVGPSRTWASVTPVVLNRHFDGKDRWERAVESIKEACQHIGLPRPRSVLLHPVSLVEGVPHAREFPRLVRKRDRGRQSHAHAVLTFDEPVCGPVLVGAGRFRGYGFCRPMDRGGVTRLPGGHG